MCLPIKMIFDSLIKMFVEQFHQKGEPVLLAFCNCAVPTKIILEKYSTLPALEILEEKEKNDLKEYVRTNFPNNSPEEKMKIAKIIYTFGTIL